MCLLYKPKTIGILTGFLISDFIFTSHSVEVLTNSLNPVGFQENSVSVPELLVIFNSVFAV